MRLRKCELLLELCLGRGRVFECQKHLVQLDGLFPFAELVINVRPEPNQARREQSGAQTHKTWDIEKTVDVEGDVIDGGGRKRFKRLAHAGAEIKRRHEVLEDLAHIFLGVRNVGPRAPQLEVSNFQLGDGLGPVQ